MTTYEKTPLGRRVAYLRKQQGFKTAQSLADSIPGGQLSKSTIVNIEAGRKSDPTVSEVMLIASALGVSPWQLILDTSDPWSALDVNGLAGPYAQMTTIEYAAATSIYKSPISDFNGFLVLFIDALLKAEEAVYRIELIKMLENKDWGPDESMWFQAPTGRVFNLFKHELRSTEPNFDLYQAAVDQYREALRMIETFGDRWTKEHPMPDRIRKRVAALAQSVAALISELPDLDYGQTDTASADGSPVLDPATGKIQPGWRSDPVPDRGGLMKRKIERDVQAKNPDQ